MVTCNATNYPAYISQQLYSNIRNGIKSRNGKGTAVQTASLTDACGTAGQCGPSAGEEVISCCAMAEGHAEVGVWVHTPGDDVATASVYHSDILWAADVGPHFPKACRRQLVQCVHALMIPLCIAYFMTPCSQSTSAC